MRWDELFDDLQAQAAAMTAAEVDAEVSERARIEAAKLTLQNRLGAAADSQLRLTCRGDLTITGTVGHLGSEWLLIDEGTGREALVHLAAILVVTGLGRLSRPDASFGHVGRRLGLSSTLRAIGRDRSGVRVHLCDGTVLDGTIDRVGADFFELAEHEAGQLRRRGEVRNVVVVSFAALVAVRRHGP